jgi:DNA polymerase-1
MDQLNRFDLVWLVDFEFSQPPGERPEVVCMVGREFFSGQLIRLSADELRNLKTSPIPTDDRTLFVAYYASAEINCYLALGWPLPSRILDLYVEFRNITNGLPTAAGRSLLGALSHFGLSSIDVSEKESMRELAMRGGRYSSDEIFQLLDYCQSDVDALVRLLPEMAPMIDMPRALLRGRYMAAVARMETVGVPIDVSTLQSFRDNWDSIKDSLIADVDREYNVFEGQTFKQNLFAKWLIKNNIPWPRTERGRLALDQDTFRQQAKKYPAVSALRELRHALSEMKLEKLAVGSDGRNRCMLSPFSSRTGRNQPSNNQFIFGPSVWLRGLIQPKPGTAVAYVDWSQQELGIAAALSGDQNMLAAYSSGDPYLAFAKQAGAVPADATKQSHPDQRNQFKVCALAVQYGMTEHGLASSLNQPTAFARNLLLMHRETYRTFWNWSQGNIDHAMLAGSLQTVFGWTIRTTNEANPRSLANFPMQANGAEMLRLACCLASENGIRVCCPVHDAILIEAPSDSIQSAVGAVQGYMAEASRIVLDGFELATDADIVSWPDRYMDEKRGRSMWDRVSSLCDSAEQSTSLTRRNNVINGALKVPLITTRTVL